MTNTTVYIEAPDHYSGAGPSVFLAGGITDCPDWQKEARDLLPGLVTFNPRRADFPIDDPSAADEQIAWEFHYLHKATVVLFWFPAGSSVQPIAMYELGRYAALGRALAVGVEPGYLRETDVRVQLGLCRSDIVVQDDLHRTCAVAWKKARPSVLTGDGR